MLLSILGWLQWSGKVGPGTIMTFVALVVAAAWAQKRWDQGDPSDWRENYLGEVEKRKELEVQVNLLEEKVKTQAILIQHLESTRSLEPILVELKKITDQLGRLSPS